MGFLASIFSGFAVALFLPWVHRPEWKVTGWLLALLPASIALYLGSLGAPVDVSFPWVPGLGVDLAFHLDGLSLLFVHLICLIGGLVFIYSAGYIHGKEHAGRFFSFMLMFMASMLGLVLADNLITFYIFFELTSLASFLLIGFESEKPEARRAARQALVVTSAGGLALFAAILLIGQVTETYTISEFIERSDLVQESGLYLPILLLVLTGAFAKSAQMPFHFWLPNAMEAPVPVSAFLHSAAMVKAGIYVLARFTSLLGGTDAWHIIVTGVGASTMLVSGWLALHHRDLKPILAYATIMALGLVTMLLGIGGEEAVKAALLYVVVHSCYKAALFMVAGAIDHETSDRDVVRLSGLRKQLPWTFAAAVLAALSMAGLPPFLGFLGKEEAFKTVLEHTAVPFVLTTTAVLAGVALVAVAAVIVLRPFFGEPRESPSAKNPASPSLWLSPLILGIAGFVLGLFPGLIDQPLLVSAASATLGESVTFELSTWNGLTPELGLSVLTLIAGALVYLFWRRLQDSKSMRGFASVFGSAPHRAFEHGVEGLESAADRLTRFLQHGILRYYVATVLLASFLLIGGTFIWKVDFLWPGDLAGVRAHEWVLTGIIIASAAAALVLRSRLGAILALSGVSYGIALVFLLFGAPDLAIAQLLIETLLAVLVVLAFIDLPRLQRLSSMAARARDAFLALGVGAVVTILMLVGLGLPFDDALSPFFAQSSYTEAHGRNIVNTILVDFRALDTLGEISVLVLAGIGAFALMRIRGTVIHREGAAHTTESGPVAPPSRGESGHPREDAGRGEALFSLILRTTTRVLVPVMVLFSLYLLLEGHQVPGGGFSGGLMAAGAFTLYSIAYGVDKSREALPLRPPRLVGLGLALALAGGLLPLFLGGSFLEGSWTTLPLWGDHRLELGTPMFFDVGVYLIVAGMVMSIIFVFDEAYTRLFTGVE